MGAALCVFVVADYTLQFNSVTYDKLGSATYTCVCVPIDIYVTNMHNLWLIIIWLIVWRLNIE